MFTNTPALILVSHLESYEDDAQRILHFNAVSTAYLNLKLIYSFRKVQLESKKMTDIIVLVLYISSILDHAVATVLTCPVQLCLHLQINSNKTTKQLAITINKSDWSLGWDLTYPMSFQQLFSKNSKITIIVLAVL